MIEARDRVIVALDVPDAEQARTIVHELNGHVGAFKIGLQLFTAAGPGFVRDLVESGARIFLDLKFHDIPNTVAKASVEVAKLGVWMFNVHALGGAEMMRRAVAETTEHCDRARIARPIMIAVTILTSSDSKTLAEVGINPDVEAEVLNLAQLTSECGLDGVVASPLETALIRRRTGAGFKIVTPGIRPAQERNGNDSATSDDQKRVMTPASAIASGADYLVIGRPILEAEDRRAAARRIIEELS